MDVEYIKRFTAQLQLHSFSYLETLEEREVSVVDSRTSEDIASEAAEESGIVWYPESAWIKPGRGSVHCISSSPAIGNSLLTKRIWVSGNGPSNKRVGDKIWPQVVVRSTRPVPAKIRKIAGNY